MVVGLPDLSAWWQGEAGVVNGEARGGHVRRVRFVRLPWVAIGPPPASHAEKYLMQGRGQTQRRRRNGKTPARRERPAGMPGKPLPADLFRDVASAGALRWRGDRRRSGLTDGRGSAGTGVHGLAASPYLRWLPKERAGPPWAQAGLATGRPRGARPGGRRAQPSSASSPHRSHPTLSVSHPLGGGETHRTAAPLCAATTAPTGQTPAPRPTPTAPDYRASVWTCTPASRVTSPRPAVLPWPSLPQPPPRRHRHPCGGAWPPAAAAGAGRRRGGGGQHPTGRDGLAVSTS